MESWKEHFLFFRPFILYVLPVLSQIIILKKAFSSSTKTFTCFSTFLLSLQSFLILLSLRDSLPFYSFFKNSSNLEVLRMFPRMLQPFISLSLSLLRHTLLVPPFPLPSSLTSAAEALHLLTRTYYFVWEVLQLVFFLVSKSTCLKYWTRCNIVHFPSQWMRYCTHDRNQHLKLQY